MSSEPADPAEPPFRRTRSFAVVNQRREITKLVQLVEQLSGDWELSDDVAFNVSLLLDEFVSNVIKYGYSDTLEHQIDIHVELESGVLTIRIEDDGKPFNPLDAPLPDLDLPVEKRPIGGLGIFIARTMADSIGYSREAGRNVLTIRKTTA